jgi:hypothetical protein
LLSRSTALFTASSTPIGPVCMVIAAIHSILTLIHTTRFILQSCPALRCFRSTLLAPVTPTRRPASPLQPSSPLPPLVRPFCFRSTRWAPNTPTPRRASLRLWMGACCGTRGGRRCVAPQIQHMNDRLVYRPFTRILAPALSIDRVRECSRFPTCRARVRGLEFVLGRVL